MTFNPRPLPFLLAASDHGPIIINHNDYNRYPNDVVYGLGYQILSSASYDRGDMGVLLPLLSLRKEFFGENVFALDCGANIGIHTLEFSKHMTGWGFCLAVEAQERLFYALAGNIALNNCFNAKVIHAALSDKVGLMKMPIVNYNAPSCFGALELIKNENTEFIGQDIDYSEENMTDIRTLTIDSLELNRVDLMKIDVEGMELKVLEGSYETIKKYKPILWIEQFKVGENVIKEFLDQFDYKFYNGEMNLLAIHRDDKCQEYISVEAKTPEPEKVKTE